jgi:uncharacterized OB-fold protein
MKSKCKDCGHEQMELSPPCQKCQSTRLEIIKEKEEVK